MTIEKRKEGKRKYGEPRSPQGERAIMVAKNKKVRQSQACDRCRLKKIKCDGMKPSCSQCTKVNFACRTSDRLTRRGFPRGYTEMLETEVVRLQKLLDGKDMSGEPLLEETNGDVGRSNSSSFNNTINNNDEDGNIKPLITPSTNGGCYSPENELISSPSAGNNKKSSGGGGDGELELPFVNDTFHYYDNYRREENYMGNSTWNVLTGSLPAAPNESTMLHFETDCFTNYQLSAMKNILHLDSNFSFLPKFLLVKYDYNLSKLFKLLKVAIADFGNFENALVPILYPFDKWENELLTDLIKLQKREHNGNDDDNNNYSKDINPISLLTLLYIIQLHWSCFNDFKLFQLTKMVCLSSKTKLETLQCILLASFYYMGGQPSSIIHRSSDNSQVWATELLHIAYSMVLNLGLYVNSKRMISLQVSNWEILHQHHRVVTFWVFQFLDSWWSLLQGLPKSNFLVDEFHPQSLKSLNIPALTPFMLLSNFTTDSLDGCNLLHTLTGGHSNGRSRLIYVTESFRQLLVKWKLYHQIQDHEDNYGSEGGNSRMTTTLTKPDMVEIQLTLIYLVISFLSNERFTNPIGSESGTISTDPDNIPLHGSNLEELSYEILSLYSLTLMDHTRLEQPQQLKILHLLPCNNSDIIRLCLTTLNNWATDPRSSSELDGQVHWKFLRYQNMVNQWCKFYMVDKLEDPLLQQLVLSFKLNLNYMSNNGTNGQTFNNWNEVEYLQNVDMFNDNPQVFTKSQLLRSNPHAVMEQFDIFAQMSEGSRPIFNNIQSTNLQESQLSNFAGISNPSETKKPKSNISEHDSFNIIDMSKYRSQILIANEESDDGYVEDDDDDDDDSGNNDFNKPLEIPLGRRTGSLFQRNYNSYDHNSNDNNCNDNELPLDRGYVKPRRHTLDHVLQGQVTHPDVNHLDGPGSNKNRQEELASLQDGGRTSGSGSSHGAASLQNYALDANSGKRNRSQSLSVPPNSDPNHESITTTSASQATPVAPYQNEALLGDIVDEDSHDTRSGHNHFVETPRTLVDMLMLPPSTHQPPQVVNPSSTLAASSIDTNRNELYKKT